MGGFEPCAVDPSEVPPALWQEMQNCGDPELSALGITPAPVLVRQTSMLHDCDLQSSDLMITATPVARHLLRMRFKLQGDRQLAQQYLLIVPRLKTIDSGHARYADNEIR